jgi:hypothetical protein
MNCIEIAVQLSTSRKINIELRIQIYVKYIIQIGAALTGKIILNEFNF